MNQVVKKEKTDLLQLANLVQSDYSSFLKKMESQKEQKPIQLSFRTSLLQDEKNKEKASALINANKPVELLISTESERLNGYLMALNRYSAENLNISPEDYKESKKYLEAVQTKLNQRKNIQQTSYAGTQTLITKKGSTANKVLLSQKTSAQPEKIKKATTDLSSYINGILVKNHERNYVNVVHSKVNYQRFPEHYQTDLNNDKKPEVITRDENNVYVKYADDTETKIGQKFSNYTMLTPQLKNKGNKYEQGAGAWRGGKDEIKIYDQNREVKNFKI